eukprot:4224707-Prymnesium_polylepis.1
MSASTHTRRCATFLRSKGCCPSKPTSAAKAGITMCASQRTFASPRSWRQRRAASAAPRCVTMPSMPAPWLA